MALGCFNDFILCYVQQIWRTSMKDKRMVREHSPQYGLALASVFKCIGYVPCCLPCRLGYISILASLSKVSYSLPHCLCGIKRLRRYKWTVTFPFIGLGWTWRTLVTCMSFNCMLLQAVEPSCTFTSTWFCCICTHVGILVKVRAVLL